MDRQARLPAGSCRHPPRPAGSPGPVADGGTRV